MAKRLIAFLLSHDSFALILMGDLIIAASNKKISVRKPSIKKKPKEWKSMNNFPFLKIEKKNSNPRFEVGN